MSVTGPVWCLPLVEYRPTTFPDCRNGFLGLAFCVYRFIELYLVLFYSILKRQD